MKRDLFFIFAFYITSVYGNITYKAKFIGNVKVSGNSDLVYALSVTQCLALCNKNSDCDAITYYDELNKCRLFKKCAPVQQLNMSAHYWFYAKRPPTSNNGYVHDEHSDSCIKIINQRMSYDEADDICAQEQGYLAVLNTYELRILATKMLKLSGDIEAWINPPSSSEKYAKNRVILRKKHKFWKNNRHLSTRLKPCWTLKYNQLIKSSSCSDQKISICQLFTY